MGLGGSVETVSWMGRVTRTSLVWVASPPLGLVHLKVYFLSEVMGPVDHVPESVWLPLQSPEAWQEVASEDDQERVADPPLVTVNLSMLKFRTGAGELDPEILTANDAELDPPGPTHLITKTVLAVKFPVGSDPEAARVPMPRLQGPETASQEVALIAFQIRVEEVLELTWGGSAEKDISGGGLGGPTIIRTTPLFIPPGPVHSSTKSFVPYNFSVSKEPEVGWDPDQVPIAGVASQESAPVVFQERWAVAP